MSFTLPVNIIIFGTPQLLIMQEGGDTLCITAFIDPFCDSRPSATSWQCFFVSKRFHFVIIPPTVDYERFNRNRLQKWHPMTVQCLNELRFPVHHSHS